MTLKMTTKTLTTYTLLIAAASALLGCSKPSDGNNAAGDGVDNTRYIAGTSATGAPASYSNNCMGAACVRANSEGNYLMVTDATESSLIWSDLALANGDPRTLYSRYRHDSSLTSAIVNINPTTHALLDAWSMQSEATSINSCAEDSACASRIARSFTENIEQTMLTQLEQLLGDAYPTGRNPFDDIYIADPDADPLDDLHDHLGFVVTADNFEVYDNNGDLLTSTPLETLFQSSALADVTLTDEQYSTAQSIPPVQLLNSPITIDIRVSPSRAQEAPVDFFIDVRNSSSSDPNSAPITFSHDLTLASGTTLEFDGETVEVTVSEGGNHVWAATATDATGRVVTAGVEIQVLGSDPINPQFGGAGSCIPVTPLNANSQNICQETLNGSLKECDAIVSGSVNLTTSSAPCAREIQNEGDLFGVCTLLDLELRVFTYENPDRITSETFTEAQSRVENQCLNQLSGDWSTEP